MPAWLVGSLTKKGRTGNFKKMTVSPVLDMTNRNMQAHVTSRWLEMQVQILGDRSGTEMWFSERQCLSGVQKMSLGEVRGKERRKEGRVEVAAWEHYRLRRKEGSPDKRQRQ